MRAAGAVVRTTTLTLGTLEMPELADLLQVQRREDLPEVRPGDTVRVHVRVVEGNRERLQMFEGVVIEVRKPKTFEGSFRVRRAKLYYLRELTGKAARIKERRTAPTARASA